MNEFFGLDNEDPYNHLTTFYELIGIMGMDDKNEYVTYLRLFPFSLSES